MSGETLRKRLLPRAAGAVVLVLLADQWLLRLQVAGPWREMGLVLAVTAAGAWVGARLLEPLREAAREREEARRREAETRAELEALLGAAPVGMALYDSELRCVRVNPALGLMVGQAASAHVGRRPGEVLPELGAALEPGLRRALQAGGPVLEAGLRVVLPGEEAERHWLASYLPVRGEGGRVQGVAAVVVEVTARQQAEQRRREAEQRLAALERTRLEAGQQQGLAESLRAELHRSLKRSAQEWSETFEAVGSPLVVLGLEGKVQRMNEAARVLLGQGRDLVGEELGRVVAGTPWEQAVRLVGSLGGGVGSAGGQVRDEAARRTWEVAVSRTEGPEDTEARVILVAQEVTRLLELQASLRRSETMAALGAVVAGVAHEIRNPLFSITAIVDAVEATVGADSPLRPFQDILRGEVQRINHLVSELFEYGRPTQLEHTVGPLEPVLAEAIQACSVSAQKAQVAVERRGTVGACQVRMDARRLFHALRNLVENAVQHSPAGTAVEVGLEEVAEEGHTWVQCTVRDRGPGFKEEDLPRLFEPFFTKRRGGTGLGLSIVQRILDEHQGRVLLRNHPDGGAEVVVRLPAVG